MLQNRLEELIGTGCIFFFPIEERKAITVKEIYSSVHRSLDMGDS